jgi:hypothetical protein
MMAQRNVKDDNQKTKAILNAMIARENSEIQKELTAFVDALILSGASKVEIQKQVRVLSSKLNNILKRSISGSTDAGLSYMTKIGTDYIKGVKAATGQKMPYEKQMILEWGKGLDEKVLNAVWDKVWPDGNSLPDRTMRISQSAGRTAEDILRKGTSEGTSARDLSKLLHDALGIEKKAAFRLAAHTTNTAYHEANAEISMTMPFVMGIRIMRADDGSEDCDICSEHGGDVGGDGKEYRKSDFGGRDIDLWTMTNTPQYHPSCKCEVEYIEMDAFDFVQYAVEKYSKN